MGKILKTDYTKYFGEDVKQLKFTHCWLKWKWYNHFEKQFVSFLKIQTYTIHIILTQPFHL